MQSSYRSVEEQQFNLTLMKSDVSFIGANRPLVSKGPGFAIEYFCCFSPLDYYLKKKMLRI